MKNTAILILLLILSSSCSNNLKSHDLQPIENHNIIRFDNNFYTYLQNPTTELGDSLIQMYPQLLPAIALTVTNSTPLDNKNDYLPLLVNYYSHPALLPIYVDVEKTFSDVSIYEKSLAQLKVKTEKVLPSKTLPKLSFHVSGFKENTIVVDSIISVSIDKYLGYDYPIYLPYFEPYERILMQPQYILQDFVKAWLISDVISDNTDKQETLLDEIIYQGKILYALTVVMPSDTLNDADIMGYTVEQMDWCTKNEKQIWKTIVENSNIANTDRLIISGYIDNAPYTIPLGKKSPGRVGNWIGYEIVKQYAMNEKLTLQEILDTDALTILKKSKYNP